MCREWEEYCRANMRFRDGADHCMQAMTLAQHGQPALAVSYEGMAIEALGKAAELFGYDLVKREAVKVEEAA